MSDLHLPHAVRCVLRHSVAAAAFAPSLAAQTPDPVQWSIAQRSAPRDRGDTTTLVVSASIAPGWHVYSLTQRDEGPIPLRVTLADDSLVRSAGRATGPAPRRIPTSPFGIPVEWYSRSARFVLPVRVTAHQAPNPTARVAIRYQACTEAICLPPKTIQLTQPLTRHP